MQDGPDEDLDELIHVRGYEVRRWKQPFARLLFEACEDRGLVEDERPNLRQLSKDSQHAPWTLINTLQSKGYPKIETLLDLEAVGIPVERSLAALGVIARRRRPTAASPARHRMLRAVRELPESEAEAVAPYVLRLLRSPRRADSGHGPGPTPSEPS